MIRFVRNYSIEIIGILAMILLIYFVLSGQTYLGDLLSWTREMNWVQNNTIQNITLIFMSIFIEGLTFILIGALVSSIISTFVKQEMIWKVVPRNPILSIPLAACMGIILPLCECGIVPMAKRLMQKGLPPYVAVTFLLSVPVVNPITIFSTYIAFGYQWKVVILRLLFVLGISMAIGFLTFLLFRNKPVSFFLKEPQPLQKITSPDEHDHGHHHEHPHSHSHTHHGGKWSHTLLHTIFEFLDTVKYFVFGALIAATFQTFVGVEGLQTLAKENEVIVVLVIMALAFGLSICSSADAFLAASFRTVLGPAPLLAFMVYGPMMDIKNVSMMVAQFKKPLWLLMICGTTFLTFGSILLFV